MSTQELTPAAFDALRAAVNLARELQIGTVRVLRHRLVSDGYAAEDVDAALRHWGANLRRSGGSP